MIQIQVTLTNAQAEALLRRGESEAGWFSRPAKTLINAERRVLDAVQDAWNANLEGVPQEK